MIYINTIQQNIAHSNNLKNSINNINNQIFQESADIERLQNDMRDLEIQKENLVKQTNYRIENLKSQINNLKTNVNELDVQKENLIKQTKYQISTLKSQINDLESQRKYTSEEIKILEFQKDNIQNIQTLKPPTI